MQPEENQNNQSTEPFNDAPSTPPAVPSSTNPSFASPVTSVQPEAQPLSPQSSQVVMPSAKKSRKKLIIISALAAFIVVLGGGFAAFALWYSTPEKAVGDAVSHLMTAKTTVSSGTFSYVDSPNKGEITIAFDTSSDTSKLAGQLNATATIKADNINLEIKGSTLVTESGAVYVRLENALKLYEEALKPEYLGSMVTPQLETDLRKFVTKIDNKWIKIEQSDIEDAMPEYKKQQACLKDAINTFMQDKKQQKQAFRAYDKNRFLELHPSELGASINGVDSVAYDVHVNVSKSQDFNRALEDTDLFKTMTKCTASDTSSDDSQTSNPTAKEIADMQEQVNKLKTTLWVSRWGHEVTKFKTAYTEDEKTVTVEFTTKANQKIDLKEPSDSISASTLVEDFQQIISSAYQEPYTEDSASQDFFSTI